MDNIANIGGRDTFAYSGARPWHMLGTKVPGLMTVAEALLAGGLDWEVEKRRVMTADTDMVMIPNIYAIGRLGPEKQESGELKFMPFSAAVKGRYTIVQNAEAFDFFNNAIDDGVACIETVGGLGTGEVVFALAKVPDMFEPIKGDPMEKYILLTTSHDGSSNIQATFTTIRVVCWNTLNAALGCAKNVIKIRHTKNAKKRLDEAHKLMAQSEKYWERLAEAYNVLAMRDMTRLDVITFIEEMFPGKKVKKVIGGKTIEIEEVSTRTENNRMKVIDLFAGKAKGTNGNIKGSAYQMYQSVTEYIDHERSVKGAKDGNEKAVRWEASVFGSGQAFRQKAFDKLMMLTA